jgi:hypothetical protein
MCIVSLFGKFNKQAHMLSDVPIGITGYLDMVSPEHFRECEHPEMALRGMDRSGRLFYSFFLTIEERKKFDPEWKKTDCIYTFFQRYSGHDKVALCTSHLKPDYAHVFQRAVKTTGNGCAVEKTEEEYLQKTFQTLLKGGVFESEAKEDIYQGSEPTETLFRVRVFQPGKKD